jgi:5-methylcytosine-specific restriction endonuclease McrA
VTPPRLRKLVRDRAAQRCEYCRFHEYDLPFWPFHLDHIVPQQHSGTANPDNLAWACQRCNLCKGTNLTGIDPDSTQVVPLFHPRGDCWEEHFTLLENRIMGRTPTGRATVWLLQMNRDERLELRAELMASGRWPPPH